MSRASEYLYWQGVLSGYALPVTAEDPQSGYYRYRRNKQEPTRAVAIWRDGREMVITLDGRVVADPTEREQIWIRSCKTPVTEEAYEFYIANNAWPADSVETEDGRLAIGGNNPPEGPEAIRDRIGDLVSMGRALLKRPVGSEDDANRLVNLAKELQTQWRLAEEERKLARGPHDKAIRVIQESWTPVQNQAETTKNDLLRHATSWAKLEEQRRRREAEAQATVLDEAPPPPPVRLGTSKGRRATLRTVKRAMIKDYNAVVEHFKGDERVVVLMQKLADEAIRDGQKVPGAVLDAQDNVTL